MTNETDLNEFVRDEIKTDINDSTDTTELLYFTCISSIATLQKFYELLSPHLHEKEIIEIVENISVNAEPVLLTKDVRKEIEGDSTLLELQLSNLQCFVVISRRLGKGEKIWPLNVTQQNKVLSKSKNFENVHCSVLKKCENIISNNSLEKRKILKFAIVDGEVKSKISENSQVVEIPKEAPFVRYSDTIGLKEYFYTDSVLQEKGSKKYSGLPQARFSVTDNGVHLTRDKKVRFISTCYLLAIVISALFTFYSNPGKRQTIFERTEDTAFVVLGLSITAFAVLKEFRPGNYSLIGLIKGKWPINDAEQVKRSLNVNSVSEAKIRCAHLSPQLNPFGNLNSSFMTHHGNLKGIEAKERPKVSDLLEFGYAIAGKVLITPTGVAKLVDPGNGYYVTKSWDKTFSTGTGVINESAEIG